MTAVLPFSEARHIVEQQARNLQPGATEVVPLLQARGRVLAEPIVADRDFPPFPRATRDGYAVRAADLAALPVSLQIVGEVRAGAAPEAVARPVNTGECVEIMTGAPVPPGADAVVMVEYTNRRQDKVDIQRAVAAGENLVPRGAEGRAGSRLLAPGIRLDHAVIAVAASVGRRELRVYVKPSVAVLATGDELVELSAAPGPHQIRNSNSYSVAAQVAATGGVPLILPVAGDNREQLRQLITRGLTADLLLLTGGVSAGKYDLVELVLKDLCADFFFTGASIQPGKPAVFGRVPINQAARAGSERLETEGWKLFFGLPGNPVSTMVTFELFARPVIEALAGATPAPLRFLRARLKTDFKISTGLTRFLPASLSGEFDDCEVQPLHWHGSGDIAANARADCYLVVPPDRDRLVAGEMVSVMVRNG